jgi:hypothetical protein
MKVGDVMDEIAERLRQAPSLAGRTNATPPASITGHGASVGYPDSYTFDAAYSRGLDRMTLPVWVVVGNPTERQTRDRLTKYVDGSGEESIKALLEDDDEYQSFDTLRVASIEFLTMPIQAIDYLTAIFNLEITGQGA